MTDHPAVVAEPLIVHRHRLSQPCNQRCWVVEREKLGEVLEGWVREE